MSVMLVDAPLQAASFNLNSDGSFDYTPQTGFTGNDSFTYSVEAGGQTSEVATVTLNITPVNVAPVATPIPSVNAMEDDPDVSVALFDFFDDDRDADIHLSYEITANTNPGLFADIAFEQATGTLRLNLAPNDFGTADITLLVTDTEGASLESTLTVNVAPVNDVPSATDDVYLALPDETLFVGGGGPDDPESVLFNDFDPDVFNGIDYGSGPADVLSATLVSGLQSGTLVFQADGSFEYTPDPGFSGVDSFTYEIDDGSVTSNVATVEIHVSQVANGVPVAVDDEFDVGADPLVIDSGDGLLANDSDADGDPLEAILVSGPSDGELILNSDGSFVYTPSTETFAGDDIFTYQVTDGRDTSELAQVKIKRRKAKLTAFRPQILPPMLATVLGNPIYDPRYGRFPDTPVPSQEEGPQSTGVGIRINGDDDDGDGVADLLANDTQIDGEDDLIRVKIGWENQAVGDILVLKRSNMKIQVWKSPDKQTPAFIGNNLAIQITEDDPFAAWIEWTNPNHGTANLTFEIQNAAGQALASDVIGLKTIKHVVIALGGENDNPRAGGDAFWKIATDMYKAGFDVHMYNDSLVYDGVFTGPENAGAGPVYDETVSAIQDRKVQTLAVFGYSHGGGSTYDLVKRLDDNRADIGTFTVQFTAYIDAIRQTVESPVGGVRVPVGLPEVRRPPSSQYHMNFYQTLDPVLWLTGRRQDVDADNPAPDFEMNVTRNISFTTDPRLLAWLSNHFRIVRYEGLHVLLKTHFADQMELY